MEEKDLEWNIDIDGVKLFVGLSNYVYDYINLVLSKDDDRKIVEDLFEKNDGMKCLIRDMYNNPDKRFITLYKDKFVDKLGLDKASRSKKYSKRFDYFNNLYCLFEAYRFNKDDYDNFESIISDIVSVSSNNIIFSDVRKRFIDVVVRNKNYKNLDELGNFFKNVVLVKEENELFDSIFFYKNMFKLIEKILENDSENHVRIKVANEVINRFLCDSDKLKVDLLYDDILLSGNRFSYINDKLMEVEDNILIRKQIFSRIIHLNDRMFSYLNIITNGNDSFNLCMNMVFNSDTYKEILNKLDVLDEASFEYEIGNNKKVFTLIKSLNTDDYKENINGVVVKYSNGILKPRKIIDRMKDLYCKIDDSKTEDFISMIHDSSININSFYGYLGEFKKEEVFGCEENVNNCTYFYEDDNYDIFSIDIKKKVKELFKKITFKKDK